MMENIVEECLELAAEKKEKAKGKGKPLILTRGTATIPLVGIDVPFHSRELLSGVPSFRNLLRPKFDALVLEQQLDLLIDRYIPNLIAKPFSLEKSYVEEVFATTNSPLLARVLEPDQWDKTSRAELTHTLIVELLAYQFASPVQWIQTQALLFHPKHGVHRFVEVCPAPTLTNMALRTLQTGDFGMKHRKILWFKRDRDAVFYRNNQETIPSAREKEKLK